MSDLEALRAQVQALTDALVSMVEQHCTCDDGTLDSLAISANGEAMDLLGDMGRLVLESSVGRRVIGRWPAPTPEEEAALQAEEERREADAPRFDMAELRERMDRGGLVVEATHEGRWRMEWRYPEGGGESFRDVPGDARLTLADGTDVALRGREPCVGCGL